MGEAKRKAAVAAVTSEVLYKPFGATDLMRIAVGEASPVHVTSGGMLALLFPTDAGIDVMLVARADGITASERRSLETATVGVYSSGRMLWLILWGGSAISWDAPHHPGHSGNPQVVAALKTAAGLSAQATSGQYAQAIVVDQDKVALVRMVPLSVAAVRRIGATIIALPEAISNAAYNQAMVTDQGRMTTAQMMRMAIR